MRSMTYGTSGDRKGGRNQFNALALNLLHSPSTIFVLIRYYLTLNNTDFYVLNFSPLGKWFDFYDHIHFIPLSDSFLTPHVHECISRSFSPSLVVSPLPLAYPLFLVFWGLRLG